MKSKKYYLTLFANRNPNEQLPQGLEDAVSAQASSSSVRFEQRGRSKKRKRGNGDDRFGKKTREWILSRKSGSASKVRRFEMIQNILDANGDLNFKK